MSSSVSLHDRTRLQAAFDALPPPGKRFEKVLDAALQCVPEIQGVKLDPLRRLIRRWSEKKSLYAACWHWIRPSLERTGYQVLPDIQRRVELDYMSSAKFRRRLIEECAEVAEKQPALARQIESRIAEAEAADHQNRTFENDHYLHEHQRALTVSSSRLSFDRDASSRLAAEQISDLLGVAAGIVAQVLSPPDRPVAQVDANLMLKVSPTAEAPDSPGAAAARRLWGDFGATDHRLVVVAETRGRNHLGFWIPLARSQPGCTIPGAPIAFAGTPNAIFVDDLPLFTPDKELYARWEKYLSHSGHGHFTGTAFVSFPLIDRSNRSQPATVGVLNVNIANDRWWPRAVTAGWCELALKRLAPWYGILIEALAVRTLAAQSPKNQLPDFLADLGPLLVEPQPRLLEGPR